MCLCFPPLCAQGSEHWAIGCTYKRCDTTEKNWNLSGSTWLTARISSTHSLPGGLLLGGDIISSWAMTISSSQSGRVARNSCGIGAKIIRIRPTHSGHT
eukprot:2681274-Prymnesium_polylepis.1